MQTNIFHQRMRALIFFGALLCFSPFTKAACGLGMTASNVSINWDLNFTSVAIQIQLTKSAAEACNFGIGISKGGAASYPTRRAANGSRNLIYQLYSNNGLSQIIKDVPDITSASDVIFGGFQTGTNLTQNQVYYVQIPYNLATSPTLAAAGTYTDNFIINLYEGADPTTYLTPVASASITLTVSIAKMIALSVIDPGGGFSAGSTSRNINFGFLSEGASSAFDMRVRTNAGFSVSFSSTHDGRLKHTDPLKNSYVPYTLFVNSAVLSLSGSSTVPVIGLTGSGQTSLDGLAYPLKIVIGKINGPGTLGGPHADDITITATTTE